MSDAPDLDHVSTPALLRHARTAYGSAMRAALAVAGYDDIPGNGLYIIGGLALGGAGVPIGQLVRELGITKQSAGQLVDTLVMRGYLARTPDPEDRRQLIITLNERGRAAAVVQTEARISIDRALVARVGAEEVARMRGALAALITIGRNKRAAAGA